MARATLVVVVVGFAARLAQWLGNPSLWYDELQLVRNLTERGPVPLVTQGLDYGQVAPTGYLLLTKISMLVFGEGEVALRLVPFLAGVAALVLFWRLATHLFNPTGAFIATAAFALNPLLISLSAVVKQYAVDVLAVVVILLALPRLWDTTRSLRSRSLLGLGVGALGFLSIPSVTVAGPAILAVLYHLWASDDLRAREGRVAALTPVVVWSATAGVAALVARGLLQPGMQQFMTDYWRGREAFAPPLLQYPTWILDYSGRLLLPGLFFRPYSGRGAEIEPFLSALLGIGALTILTLACAVSLLRSRGPAWTLAIVLPILGAVALSRLEVYPLYPRTSALLVPLMILLAVALPTIVVSALPTRAAWVRIAIAAVAVLPMAALAWEQRPVQGVRDTRSAIEELARRRISNEPVFGHPHSESALAYYGPRFGLVEGISVGPERDLRTVFSELERYRGEPSVWVLFTLVVRAEERELYLCYLDELGTEIESVVLQDPQYLSRASIHRYDLSDAARWRAADLRDFPLTDAAFEGDPPRCKRRG